MTGGANPVGPAVEDRVLQILREQFQPLFAILDAARDPDILKLLIESKAEYHSLYEGASAGQLAHFAPYLVRLCIESPLLEALVRKGWSKSWAVYVSSAKPFRELRQHFRQFLVVRTEERREFYFRFYDPRVLRALLPTCMPSEIGQLFGPVRCYVMEDQNPEILLQFTIGIRGLEKALVELSPEGPTCE